MSEDTTAKRAGRRRRTTRGGRRRSLRAPGGLRESWPPASDATPSDIPPRLDDDVGAFEVELEEGAEFEGELEEVSEADCGALDLPPDGIDDTGATVEMFVRLPTPMPPIPEEEKTKPRYRLEDDFESFDAEPTSSARDRDSEVDELTNPRIRIAGLGMDSGGADDDTNEMVVTRPSVVIAAARIIVDAPPSVPPPATLVGVPVRSEQPTSVAPPNRPSAPPPRDVLPAGVGFSSSLQHAREDAAVLGAIVAPAAGGAGQLADAIAAAPMFPPPPVSAPMFPPPPASAPAFPAPPASAVTSAPVFPAPPASAVTSAPAFPAPASAPVYPPPIAPAGEELPQRESEPDLQLVDVEETDLPAKPRELRSPPPPPPPPPVDRPRVAAAPPAPPAPAATVAAGAPAKRPPPPPSAKVEEDRQKRKQVRQWWERFFSDDYLVTVLPPTPAQIAKQVDFIEASLSLPKGGTVLDVGCGLGLQAIELARRGYLVVGLDLSLAMITRAAEAAQQQNLKVSFVHADIREMEFDGAFDGVICMDTTFGFFDDDANRDVLARMHHGLKPGGRMLLDVVNRDYVIKSQPNLVWFEGDECVCMEESEFNYFNSRLTVKRTMMREDGRQTNAEYSVRLYSLHELGQLVQQMGFRVIEVSGQEAIRGAFFGSYAPRILTLAERRTPGSRASTVLPHERGSAEMARPSFAMAPERAERPSAAFPPERPNVEVPKPPKPE